MNRTNLVNKFDAYYNDLTRIINKYIKSEGEIDWEDFLESLKKSPGVLNAELQETNDSQDLLKRIWFKYMSMEEPSFRRIVITMKRAYQSEFNHDLNLRKMEAACRIKFHGLINMIAEDYSGNIVPTLISSCNQSEWTETSIVEYYEWYNHYGS